jgi:hypothetical protein
VSNTCFLFVLGLADSELSFYDVEEVIIRLPVGGDTTTGQKLRDMILYQLELEDSIPKVFIFHPTTQGKPTSDTSQLKAELPVIDLADLYSGEYHLNFHIVTGRKPSTPRTGDLLANGSRNEMTPFTYQAMARDNDYRAPQWKRCDRDFDHEVSNILNKIQKHRGGGIVLQKPNIGTD